MNRNKSGNLNVLCANVPKVCTNCINVDMTDKDQMPKIANLPKTVYYLLGWHCSYLPKFHLSETKNLVDIFLTLIKNLIIMDKQDNSPVN